MWVLLLVRWVYIVVDFAGCPGRDFAGNKAGNRTSSLGIDTNPPQHVSNNIQLMCGLLLLEFYTVKPNL